MKNLVILPMFAVLALGVAACSKTADTSNTTTTDTNTVIEDTDANFAAVDNVDTSNATDLINTNDSNTTNAF